MAQTRTCDACGYLNDEQRFAPGWGALSGTDSLGQYVQKDLCPRCSAMLQVMLGELRRRFTTTGLPSGGSSPSPSTSSAPSTAGATGRAGETPRAVPDIDGLPRLPRGR
jgi:rubredoxin